MWHMLSETGRQIPTQVDGTAANGFLLKLKGFTLGDRLTLKPLWPAIGGRTLYHHYVGEIHVLPGADVFPNAARDNLEPGPAKQIFEKRLSDHFEQLNRQANAVRAMAHVQKQLEGHVQMLDALKGRLESPDEDAFELYREARNQVASFEAMQKELVRYTTSRPRAPLRLREEQEKSLTTLQSELAGAIKTLSELAQSAQRRTTRTSSRPRPEQAPPQVALLDRALAAISKLSATNQDARLAAAVALIEGATRLHLVPQAVAALDELRASTFTTSDEVEAIRKELRAFLGWSPTAPISLDEALLELGVSLEDEREERLVKAVDRGLLALLGGRGEKYEMALRSVADAIAQELTG